MAYAGIAGMPPETGLYVATIPLLVYALLASSQRITVGPSAAVAALSASTIAPFAVGGSADFVAMSILLAIVTGALLVVAGIARLGVIAEFLSEPVLKGFMVGVALTIVLGQSSKLFGIEVEGEGFFSELVDLVRNLGDLHLPTLIVGASSLAALFLLHKLLPQVPAALVVVVGAILSVSLLDLESSGVHVAGDIAAGFPLPGLPGLGWDAVTALVPGAIGLAIVVYGESMALSKTFGAKHRERVDADQELLALGAANAVGGIFGGFAAVGSNSRTAAADASGQRTQISSLFVVALLVVTILFLTPLFHDLPEAALGAIVIHAVWRLLNPSAVLRLRALNRFDFWAAIGTLLGVLVLDVLDGLLIGIVISLAALMIRAVRPRVTWLGRDSATGTFRGLEHEGVGPVPGTGILRFENELFFANVSVLRDQISDRLESDPALTFIVVDAEAITAIDTTAATEFGKLIEELASKGVRLVVARMESDVSDALVNSGVDMVDRLYERVADAVDAVSAEPG
jgi:high affinity sulfate transporter 1